MYVSETGFSGERSKHAALGLGEVEEKGGGVTQPFSPYGFISLINLLIVIIP